MLNQINAGMSHTQGLDEVNKRLPHALFEDIAQVLLAPATCSASKQRQRFRVCASINLTTVSRAELGKQLILRSYIEHRQPGREAAHKEPSRVGGTDGVQSILRLRKVFEIGKPDDRD